MGNFNTSTFHTAMCCLICSWNACYCMYQHRYSSALFIHFGWCEQQTRKWEEFCSFDSIFHLRAFSCQCPSQLSFPWFGRTRFSSAAFKACCSYVCGICVGMWWMLSVPFWQCYTCRQSAPPWCLGPRLMFILRFLKCLNIITQISISDT